MTGITFYGGVNEVGGNKILLEDKGTKVFLDFGMSFGRVGKYFEEYVKPRTSNGIVDYFKMGLVPDLPGIYRDDLILDSGRKITDIDVQAVLLTHAHADHVNYISFLHEKIPIYMGETCQMLINAIQEKSSRKIDTSILDFKPKGSKKNDSAIKRDVRTFRTGKKIKIDSIEAIPIHVDHSVPGAYGYIINTTSGTIVYTGDLRMHGTNSTMTDDFVNAAISSKPDVLITEGTHMNKTEPKRTEAMVYNECKNIISNSKGVVIADFNFKDVDRFRTFYNIAKELGRKLVVNLNDVFFLKNLENDPQLNLPKANDPNIIILLPKKKSGEAVAEDYAKNARTFVDYSNAMSGHEIAKIQGEVICALSFFGFPNIIDLDPTPGADYIRSGSEPYNEEQVIDQKRVDNWLERFSLTRHQSHCSGHARSEDIIEMVKKIDAGKVYPIHTGTPEKFNGLKNVTMVKEAVCYNL